MSTSEVTAIARLLADPDPGVAIALRRQLVQRAADPPGLREAVEALEDPQERARAREARLEVGRDRCAETLVRLSSSEESVCLEEGVFLVARLEDPDTDTEGARRSLDELGSRLMSVIDGDAREIAPLVGVPTAPLTPAKRLAVLSWFMAELEGFEGDAEDYEAPRNSILPEVIARKRGLPIALSVVYLLVAARAGVELYGVSAPMHFLVGGPGEGGAPLFIDPFHKGRMLDRDDVALFLRSLNVLFRPEYLAPTPPKKILARMARNLANYYASRPHGDARTRRLQRVAVALEQ